MVNPARLIFSVFIIASYVMIFEVLEHVWRPMEEVCLADSSVMNTILRETKFFQSISKNASSLTIIAAGQRYLYNRLRKDHKYTLDGHHFGH